MKKDDTVYLLVWEITRDDLAPLKQQVERILKTSGAEHGDKS